MAPLFGWLKSVSSRGIKSVVNRRLRFEALECRRVLAPVADIVDVQPDPRTTPVGQVIINFRDSVTSQPTSVFGVDINDFTLTRNAVDVSLAGLTVSGSGDTYALDLSSVTTQDGGYVLTLVAAGSGITDTSMAPLTQDAIEIFVVDTAAPSADIVNVSPDPRNTAV